MKNLKIQDKWQSILLASPEEQKKLYKRTLFIVMLSQFFSGAGFAASATSGALLAQDMFGTSLAGIPMTLGTLGSAVTAMLVGRVSQRLGRRLGLSAGFWAGALGAAGVVITAKLNIPALYLVSLFVYGAGFATNLQARYAGTDLADPKKKATAASLAMVSTTFGAVAAPSLAESMGTFANSIGVPSLAGVFIVAAVAYALAGTVIFLLLRPDPLLLAKVIAQNKKSSLEQEGLKQREAENSTDIPTFRHGVIIGGVIMAMAQMIMVMIMTMTPVHMGHNDFGMGQIGLVISVHIGSMFFPYLFTGLLVDRIGRKNTAIASGTVLILSAILAAIAPPDSLVTLIIALSLLGLGWNLGMISGTAIVIDSAKSSNLAKVQGNADVFVSLSGATAALISGFILASFSYAALAVIGCFFSILLIMVIIWSSSRKKHQA